MQIYSALLFSCVIVYTEVIHPRFCRIWKVASVCVLMMALFFKNVFCCISNIWLSNTLRYTVSRPFFLFLMIKVESFTDQKSSARDIIFIIIYCSINNAKIMSISGKILLINRNILIIFHSHSRIILTLPMIIIVFSCVIATN